MRREQLVEWLTVPARLPLRVLIPASLLLFGVVLGVLSLEHNRREALEATRTQEREQLVQRLTRMQGTLEYLVRRGDHEQLQAVIAALGADPVVQVALLVDEHDRVLASLRRTDLGRAATPLLPLPAWSAAQRQTSLDTARRLLTGQVYDAADGRAISGFYPVRLGTTTGEMRPTRVGVLFVKQDLTLPLAETRRAVEKQARDSALAVVVAALLLWLFLHFVIARRVNRLVTVVNALAGDDPAARTGLRGRHELAQIGAALDRMADDIADREARLRESEQHLRQALTAARMGSWYWDMRSGAVQWSETVAPLFGLEAGTFAGTYEAYLDCIHPDDVGRVTQTVEQAVAGGAGYEIEHRVRWPDGSLHWLAGRGEVQHDAGGRAVRMTGLVWDITERRRAEDALFEAKERAEVTLHSIGDGVITTDAVGHVEYINPVAERLTGWNLAEAAGRPLTEIFHIVNEYSRVTVENPVQRCLRDGAIVGLANHTLLITRDGRELAIEDSAAPIRNRAGAITGVVMVFHDVTSSRELANQLSWQASHDVLTGLTNRREFENRLGRALASAHAGQAQHALLYIDLDQFKLVNDTCGHSAGDELLRQLAGLMQTRMRATDVLARLGGDEFGVLLEHCPPAQAERIAETLRAVMRSYRFAWEHHAFEVSASIGVVTLHAESGDQAAVLAAADMACYAAKEAGRNRIHVYRASDAELRQRHGEMLWVARLNEALARDRFLLYRQSIVPTRGNGEGELCEVLLRLRTGDDTLVTPAEFLSAAERYNLMPAIDRWVIRTLFTRHGEHLRAAVRPGCAHAARVSINLSGATLSDDTFLDFVRGELHAHAIPPERVCFEITETAAIANLGRAVTLIEALRALGCRFALDDFGSGLSSFGYLKNLPVDYLKIDGTLVRHIADNPIDYAMVEAINGIGHVMGIRTIAEFVENDAIRERLTRIGVDYLQGYGIDRPTPLT